MNINDYTGRGYDFRRYNCWGHVRAVRADAGIETPAFDVARPSQEQDAFAGGQVDSRGLVRVDTPQDFDAVLMGDRQGGRIVWHSGVYYNGSVSHCERAARQVKLESLADIRARYSEIQFWR